LLSWTATLFEYLMPMLLTRNYPDTLLDQSCRAAIRRHVEYGASRGAPWGISESAYSAVDHRGIYQYKAFGVPGLGLKRGLGSELVVAPYATALAAILVPQQSTANLRRLAALGLEGDYGFYDAIDYTDRTQAAAPTRSAKPSIVRTHMAHHQGMTLVALANALLDDRMVARFHRDPRVRATDDGRATRRRDGRRPATRSAPPSRPRCRCATTARRTPCFRTRRRSPTAVWSRSSPTPAAGICSATTLR
jgi:cyclic beta-1,2-glucan synthetase